jgi:outer membrane lipoprotein LolB
MSRLATTALLLALAGCASIEPTSAPPMPQAPLASSWSWQGRISAKAGDEALSGQLRWRHQGDEDVLLFSSPLGQGLARIDRDASGVVLEVPDEPPRRAATVEALTAEALGYALPVGGLVYWIQARPDPSAPFELSADEFGRPAHISQDGWSIRYVKYFDDSPYRPRRLTLSRDDLEIRLVIDEWQSE